MRPDEFWRMTWTEVETTCRGYEIRLARHREIDRFIATILINANRKKGARVVNPEEVIPLIIDKPKKKVELMSLEEYEETKRLFERVEWQKKN